MFLVTSAINSQNRTGAFFKQNIVRKGRFIVSMIVILASSTAYVVRKRLYYVSFKSRTEKSMLVS